jgi:phage major head subunit gpT-like protein
VEITFPALASINDGVQLSFNTQFGAAETVQDKFCYQATSTGAAEVYPRLNMLPGLREWIGDREVHRLSQTTFSITNREFEETIAVKRTDIEDDKFGLLTPVAQQLGLNAARLPDQLVATLLKAGHTTICYDGQNFFDSAHPDYTSTGAATTNKNYDSGSSPVWYMFDTRQVIRAVIFQRRRPFQVVPQFSMTDPQVFFNNEFRWGVDGRCNAGFGLWQVGYMSTLPLTIENIQNVITTMASYRRPDGTPLGIKPDLLVTTTANIFAAKALADNDMVPNTYSNTYVTSTTVTLLPNPVKGMFKPLENPWLN